MKHKWNKLFFIICIIIPFFSCTSDVDERLEPTCYQCAIQFTRNGQQVTNKENGEPYDLSIFTIDTVEIIQVCSLDSIRMIHKTLRSGSREHIMGSREGLIYYTEYNCPDAE